MLAKRQGTQLHYVPQIEIGEEGDNKKQTNKQTTTTTKTEGKGKQFFCLKIYLVKDILSKTNSSNDSVKQKQPFANFLQNGCS